MVGLKTICLPFADSHSGLQMRAQDQMLVNLM
jgi:hypothetical protein